MVSGLEYGIYRIYSVVCWDYRILQSTEEYLQNTYTVYSVLHARTRVALGRRGQNQSGPVTSALNPN